MSAPVGFVAFLGITLMFLGGVVITGRAARRRKHLPLVACAVASLGITIYYAEQLGHLYDLKTAGVIYPIHLGIAKATTLGYLLPLITGWLTIRNPARIGVHRACAYLVLILTVLTAATGTAMVYMSDPI